MKLIRILKNKENGVVIYLAMVMMAVLLSMALGINAILFKQNKAIISAGDSVFAFYAANSGMERMLYWIYIEDEDPLGFPEDIFSIDNVINPITGESAQYYISVNGSCGATHYCITSIGSYGETKRAVEIKY